MGKKGKLEWLKGRCKSKKAVNGGRLNLTERRDSELKALNGGD